MSYLERFVRSNVSVTTCRHMFDAQTYDVENAHHKACSCYCRDALKRGIGAREKRNHAQNR